MDLDSFFDLAEKAFAGDVTSQSELGECFYNGNVVNLDYNQAYIWLTKAAEQGDVLAQKLVGLCYFNGNGVEQNYEKAVYWLTKAAEQGNDLAIKRLSELKKKGILSDE